MSDALKDAAAKAVEMALAAGAEAAEGFGQDERDVEIRVFDRAVESLTEAGSRGIGVRAFASEGRSGYAFGTALDESSLKDLAERAVALAQVSDPDEFAGLPGETGRGDAGELVAPEFDEWDTARKVELAIAVDDAARTFDSRVSQVEQTIYADERGSVVIVNSAGLSDSYEATGAYAYSSAFAGTRDDLMTGLGLDIARGPGGLDPQAIGREAAERAVVMIGARRTEARRAPVVLDEFTAASFIGIASGALSGEAVLRGRSPFVGKEGEEIASAALELTDNGLVSGGPSSSPFDGEGVARRATPLIVSGQVQNFLYDSRTAREAGASSTGNASRGSYRGGPGPGASNVIVAAGGSSLEELIAQAGDGLYVTNVVGLHSGVNPVSGQFSVGASGIEIKDGKLAAPVREATIASDLIATLRGVRAVGAQQRWIPFGGSVLTGPILVDEMTIA
ncbi:MAG: TldD/PmbA family protein [Solirubrobacterales bacterium]